MKLGAFVTLMLDNYEKPQSQLKYVLLTIDVTLNVDMVTSKILVVNA